eukprot:scpid106874/ scgid32380/ 
MALYAVAIVPLIRQLGESNPSVSQNWNADDDSAGGRLTYLSSYWNDVNRIGPGYSYHPNPRKSVLLVKPEHEEEARRIFTASGVVVKTSGNRHLGSAIGSDAFCSGFMTHRVEKWKKALDDLSSMALTQLQVAFAVFTK